MLGSVEAVLGVPYQWHSLAAAAVRSLPFAELLAGLDDCSGVL